MRTSNPVAVTRPVVVSQNVMRPENSVCPVHSISCLRSLASLRHLHESWIVVSEVLPSLSFVIMIVVLVSLKNFGSTGQSTMSNGKGEGTVAS